MERKSINIHKVVIKNYKCFEDVFSIDFKAGINIIVGDNEAGKSTILEATNLALSGLLNGRYLRNELSQYLFNTNIIDQFIRKINAGENPEPPEILIEVYLDTKALPAFEGNLTHNKANACGISYRIHLDDTYKDSGEYEALIQSRNLSTLPIEYYTITWKAFSRDPITARSIPIKSVLVDSTSHRYANQSDVYISRIIQNDLEVTEKVDLSQAYRKMKDGFMADPSIQKINKKIDKKAKKTDRKLHISVDLSAQNSWETNLMTYLENVPFHQIGKGEQSILKTNLSLGHNKAKEANLILLEEPENHLSHSKLNTLLKSIEENHSDKQIFISTHNSFVANKLGLEKIILLNAKKASSLTALNPETFDFFKKLTGYETLRLLLCRKAVLVEGPSDELVFQRAYMDNHNGRLPIEDGIDVIAVGLTFKRFLDIAILIDKPVAVVTDNDGSYENKITKKYTGYADKEHIEIIADDRDNLKTLEPQLVDANKDNLKLFRQILDIKESEYPDEKSISDYMEIKDNKTDSALKIFESKKAIKFPSYIKKAVAWANEK